MPASSKQQQKFMGMVHALKKGDIKPSDVSQSVKDAAKSMSKKDAKDFASTPHKGLPRKVKQEILNKLKEYASKMGTNTLGGDDYTTSRKGGLRDFDGYDNVDYNKDMPMDESINEGMFSTLDQIRQDSKNVRDFVKNVFKDRDFMKMKNDKEFIKYLKSIYEGVSENSGISNWMQGRTSDYHTQLRGKKRKYDDTNFEKDNSGQLDLDEVHKVLGKPVKLNKGKKKNGTDWTVTFKNGKTVPLSDVLSLIKPFPKGIKEDMNKLSSSERIELYKLYSKAMKAMPGSPNQKKIKKLINQIRKKANLKPLPEYGQRLDLSYLEDAEAKLIGTPEPKDAIDRDIDESTLNEIGIFPVQNYVDGIIPSSFIDTTTRDKKERLKSTLRDLKNTLNHFWKQHKIPYRIR